MIIQTRFFVQILAGFSQPVYNRAFYLIRIIPFTAALLVLRLLVLFFQMLDELIFPGFARVEIEAPLSIISAPRSGSTFLHRLVVQDERFVSLKLWHTLFPSVTLFKIIDLYRRIEAKMPVQPSVLLLEWINKRSFGGWDDIHKTGLHLHEEDEHLWVQIFASPIGLMLFYPYIWRYPQVVNLDGLPEAQKMKLAQYLKRNIQRFMYIHPGKTYLLKNAASGGRVGLYRMAMPDLRIVHIERDMNESIPSALSMFSKPWNTFAPWCLGDSHETREMVRILIHNQVAYQRFVDAADTTGVCELHYEELIADPHAAVLRIYEAFGVPLTDRYAAVLEQETNKARSYQSKHKYDLEAFGLSPEALAELHQQGMSGNGLT